MVIIYVDVLFAINFIIDTLMLICGVKISGMRVRLLRIIPGGVLGGLYSAVIFFIDIPDFLLTLSKLAVSAAMILTAVKISTVRDFFVSLLCFYISNLILAGALTALMYLTDIGGKTNALLSNGSVYFNIRFPALIFYAAMLTAAVSWIVREIKRSLRHKNSRAWVEIRAFGKSVKGEGIIDTGNELTACGGRLPVIIAGFSVVEKLFDEHTAQLIFNNDFATLWENMEYTGKFLIIPYNAVGTECGILTGFRPDCCLIDNIPARDCVIAICRDNRKIIINPQVMG